MRKKSDRQEGSFEQRDSQIETRFRHCRSLGWDGAADKGLAGHMGWQRREHDERRRWFRRRSGACYEPDKAGADRIERQRCLVTEMSPAGEDHRSISAISSGDHVVVAHAATGLNNRDGPCIQGSVEAIGKGEKRI